MGRRIYASDKIPKRYLWPLLKELLQSLNPAALMPKAFKTGGLYFINQENVLERICLVVQARHLDDTLLKMLGGLQIWGRKEKAMGTESACRPCVTKTRMMRPARTAPAWRRRWRSPQRRGQHQHGGGGDGDHHREGGGGQP
jgi:hypothetical protein